MRSEVRAGLPAMAALAVAAGHDARDEDHRRAVTGLGYSAHPQAVDRLRVVMEKIVADYDVRAIAAVHRVGDLEVGDLAVVVAAACPHRDQAFAACRTLIDELKAEVPIWKNQVFADGGSEWVGIG